MLLKLVWHPDYITDGKVQPTAFRSEDLSGNPDDCVSVDRSDMAKRETMEVLAANQKQKANAQHKREVAFICAMECGKIRAVTVDGALVLGVFAAPIDGNDAHCAIRNLTTNPSRSFLLGLKSKLAALASSPITFDEAYPDAS